MFFFPTSINLEKRIKHIDGLRGLAILAVFGFHIFSINPKNVFLEKLFFHGDLGVNLFFLISGFVIFNSLNRSLNFLIFIKKRYFRLFPSMLFASLLFFFLFPQQDILNLVPGLTFVDPRIIHLITGINTKEISPLFWTLFIEFKFYYIAGLAYFFFK